VQGPKGDTGATGATGAAGPQGPAGTLGSIVTDKSTFDIPAGDELSAQLLCNTGTPVSGGIDLGGFQAGVSIQASRPDPEGGTMTSWFIAVANDSGADIPITADVACATPAGSSANANSARISNKVVTPLH
jgi:hypothetical protein